MQKNSMHTELKDSNHVVSEKQSPFVDEFKLKLSSLKVEELNTMVKKLNYLCLNLDPYDLTTSPGQTEQEIINEFRLASFLDNPFTLTNKLLQLLHCTEDELKKRVH